MHITRKNPLTATAFLVSLLLMVVLGTQARAADRKPNVIIIYTDDQGTIDANTFGAKDLYTPNIDQLAKTGVKFTQFYAAAPVCSPSRAALLTGKTPLAAGLPHNTNKIGLPTDQVTIAETLKENGYKTALIGKWHLGHTDKTVPNAQGFDYAFGHHGGCIDNYSHFFYWAGPNHHDLWENNKEVWKDGEFFPDMLVEKANAFIDENKDSPFFMYYAMNLPHYPLQGTDKWREHYKDLPSPRNMYAACVSTVDERIGMLMKKLEETGLRDNTIIIFQSDHGHSVEVRTFSGGGSAGIYRGAKFSLFEGGIRVPAIINWPKKLPEDEVREQACINMDWFPTILDLCGISYEEEQFEGRSLKKVIGNKKAKHHETLYWYSNKNRWAVRSGDWKLLKNPIDPTGVAVIAPQDSLFLVNLQTHPKELTNLAADNPAKVRELQALYQQWHQSVTK